MGTSWTKYGGDKQNTCRHDVLASTSGVLRWSLDLSAEDYFEYGSCVFTSSGDRLYVAGGNTNPQSLWCVDTNSGVTVWRTTHDSDSDTGGVWASPSIGMSGHIYVAYLGGMICKYEPNSGDLVWWSTCQQSAGTYDYIRNLTLGSGDIVYYVPTTRGGLTALDPSTGSVMWKTSSFGNLYCGNVNHPAIDESGFIYYGDQYGRFIKVNPDGGIVWVTNTSNAMVGSPSIGNNGIIYVGCDNKKLYAIEPISGSIAWTCTISGNYAYMGYSHTAVTHSGSVVILDDAEYADCIDSSGNLIWRYDLPSGIKYSQEISIGGDGTIYFGTLDGFLALNPDGTLKYSLDGSVDIEGNLDGGQPGFDNSGNIYLATSYGWIYSIAGVGSGGGYNTFFNSTQCPYVWK